MILLDNTRLLCENSVRTHEEVTLSMKVKGLDYYWPGSVIKKRLKRLARLMKKCKNTRMKERFQTILLFLNQYQPKEIADIVQRSLSTVYNYINVYLSMGLKALRPKHSPGRPCLLTEEQQRKVYDTVAFGVPKDVGFPVEMNWTAPLVKKWIQQQFGVKFSDRGVLQLLHNLGLSCTRPTYSLAKADPQKQEEFKKKFNELKKRLLNGSIDRILFEDECMIRDYQAIFRTWFPKGKQRIVPTYGKHHGVKVIGVLEYETGEVFCIHAEKYDAEVFLNFLTKIVEKYRDERIMLILDNARIHHASLIQPFLQKHEDVLELVFLPPYSPELNLIEELWGWLKRTCVYNVFFNSVNEIGQAIQNFVHEINQHPSATIDRLCVKY